MDPLRPTPPRPCPDRGDIVLGWLTKLLVVFAVVALVGIEAIAIGTARMGVQDDAATAARAASTAYRTSGDPQVAYAHALSAAQAADPTNTVPTTGFHVSPEAAVTVRVERAAETVVVSRIGWIRGWGEVSGTATSRDVS